ncbi:MAG: (2Fe-2S) ferredoxin domain-containing protein [Desulfuromonadales bacterium]|nr:(2Fe-2S) ferredoxin domain-containing protein [Desulfuromonadales bacterium]
MAKITSIADLKRFQQEYRSKKEAIAREKIIVNVSLATCSIASGGNMVMEVMQDEVVKQGIANVEFVKSGCMTYCHSEPTVEVALPGQEPVVFGKLDESGARQLVRKYLKYGEVTGMVIPENFTRVEL